MVSKRKSFRSAGRATLCASAIKKINLQDRATDTASKAQAPIFGSGDFCLIAAVPLQEVLAHLRVKNIALVAGPVNRRCAVGMMRFSTATSSGWRNTSALQANKS